MKLSFCELHSPLFLAGTNLGVKLDITKRSGLELSYDRKAQELTISYNGVTGYVPSSNIVLYVIIEATKWMS